MVNVLSKRNASLLIGFIVLLMLLATAYYYFILSANTAQLDERWASSDESSTRSIDHEAWQNLLDDYLVSDTDSGVNLFDYEGLLDDDRGPLDEYIEALSSIDPLLLNSIEQKAFWINLYNAVTVQLIIDNYPLTSITTLGERVTEFGPWNDIAIEVNAIELSLNDIEHRIIRPLYNDYRIHFAVNCASIGCPNLAAEAFIASELDQQLDDAATEYLMHPRGINIRDASLKVCGRFWYKSS